MKRTRNINYDRFRKSWRRFPLAPLTLAMGSVFMLSGCEKTDETVSLYQNADDCTRANPSMKDQCTTTYNNALKEAEKTAPKYRSQEDCAAEFGEAQCMQTPATTASNQNAPAQAGMTAQPHESGSFWMPLMAGYMMGRMMGGGGYAQQPLFSPRSAASPANGQFVDASGKSYGSATSGRTITVPKTAMTPKPATTTTTMRGGFGESIARQQQQLRKGKDSTSSRSGSTYRSHSSMGG
ncbi:DUF1190 family protein [Lonsdalea quercina]|uniref:DUF1190 family protein n=1 Tax=Lonsdalea quercina TaxID=71657 RepID=UPI00397662F8